MRVGFLIERKNYYRVLGPVVERALARGWETECWHDWSQPRRGPKALEFPDAVPTFRHGQPTIRTYRGGRDLRRLLTAPIAVDAIVALRFPEGLVDPAHPRWFGLQYTLDVAELLDASGASRFDAIGLHTPYWAARVADSLRIFAAGRPGAGPARVDEHAVSETLRHKGTIVGFPEMDQFHEVDPARVRQRLGLGPGRPVVVYAPFPFMSNPRTFWVRHIYGSGSRLRQRIAVALARRPEYRSHIERGWNDRRVVDAIRDFCDANGAALVVKARAKDPAPAYLARSAHAVLYDESYYPATILELMSVASLCVHFFSTIAYEAAYAGVPSICIAPAGNDLGFPAVWQEWFLNLDEGGSFNFPGVVYALGLDDVLGRFPSTRLSDYPLELPARARYVEKFIGFDDGKCSDRVLDAIQALVEGDRR